MRTRGQLQSAQIAIRIRDAAANLIDPNDRVWLSLNRDSAFTRCGLTLSRSLCLKRTAANKENSSQQRKSQIHCEYVYPKAEFRAMRELLNRPCNIVARQRRL